MCAGGFRRQWPTTTPTPPSSKPSRRPRRHVRLSRTPRSSELLIPSVPLCTHHADDIKAALATHGLSELINLLQAIADGTSYTARQHYRRLAFFDSSGSCVCCPPRALPHPLFERRAVGDNIDKGCIIDYCARHGGVSLNGAARYLGVAKTNRCSVCRRPGHNKNHCPGAGWI